MKLFEIWAEYQTIMYSPRYFVGCSVYDENSQKPIDEIMLHANLPYSDYAKREEIGKNLAQLVLENHPFVEGDQILELRKEILPRERSVGIGDIRIPYTVHRYNPESRNFTKGFSERLKGKL